MVLCLVGTWGSAIVSGLADISRAIERAPTLDRTPHDTLPATGSLSQNAEDRMATVSPKASRWFRALAQKVLIHEALIRTVMAHVIVLARWCTKSFANHARLIGDLDQRITEQESFAIDQHKRVTIIHAAMEPLKNHSISSQSMLESLQSHITAITGGFGRLEKAFGHLKDRFDTLQRRSTASDKRIDEVEIRVKVIDSTLKTLQQPERSSEGGFLEERMAVVEQEMRKLQASARTPPPPPVPPPQPATVYTHRSVQCSIAPDSSVQDQIAKDMKRLINQQRSLDKSLDEQRRHLDSQIMALEKRMTAEQVSMKTREDAMRGRLQSLVVSDEPSEVLTEVKALVQEKFKVIVDASKQKFTAQGERIAALEKDVYKPSLALPVGERLEVLEYDVQQLTSKEKESTLDLRTAIENLNVLQGRMDNLRLDVKNAFKKVTIAESDRKPLDVRDSAVQQLITRVEKLEHGNISNVDKLDNFQQRFEQVQHDCRQFLDKIHRLTESGSPRLNDLERVLQKATEIFSIGLVQIKQQVESLEKEIDGVSNEVDDCVAKYLDISGLESDQDSSPFSPSVCSIEAIYGHCDEREAISADPPQSPSRHGASNPLTPPAEDTGLILLDFSPTSSTRNILLDQVQQDVDELTDRYMALETKLERIETQAKSASSGNQGVTETENPIERNAYLNQRVKLLESDSLDRKLHHITAKTNSSEEIWRQEENLERSAATALLTTRSAFNPFPCAMDDDVKSDHVKQDGEGEVLHDLHALPTFVTMDSGESFESTMQPIPDVDTPSPPGHHRRPQEDANRSVALVKASSIWASPTQGETSTALEGKLGRLEEDMGRQLSQVEANLEKTAISLRDLTLLIASAIGPAMSLTQHATLQDILGPTHVASLSKGAALSTYALPAFQDTLNDLKTTLEKLQNNFNRIDSIVFQDSTKLSSLQREFDEKWKRQTATLPAVSRVNQLADGVQNLTDRMNALEYNLRYRRVI